MSSSILLLLDDGEMHPFVPGANTGPIVLSRPGGPYGDSGVISGVDPDQMTLGSHFLTSSAADHHHGARGGGADHLGDGSVVTKIEVDQGHHHGIGSMGRGGIGVQLEKSMVSLGGAAGMGGGKKSSDKKVCLWPLANNTTCGKAFSKSESLKRHLAEVHKDSSKGGGGGIKMKSGSSGVQLVHVQGGMNSSSGNSAHGGPTLNAHGQIATPLNTPNPLPFLNLNGTLPQTNKPLGSKVCRWVQNDGTVCGKAFSKLDSLRRHVNELHKGVRPFACNLCEKSYGRRDYLDRHIKTHSKKPKPAPGSLEWGPNSGVLLQGDEAPPPPKVPKKKRKDIPPEEKKICLWVMEDGTACGKTFTKFDSLKRHVSEAHKGIRPFTCTLCGKTYGRRDYLLRHLKSHNDAEVANLNIPKISANPVQQNHGPSHSQGSSSSTNLNSSGGSGSHLGLSASSNAGGGSSSAVPTINFSQLVPQPPQALSGILTSPTSNISGAGHTTIISSGSQGGGGHQSKSSGSNSNAKKRAAEDKKTCKWVLDNGTVCGRTFSKFDSLRRHVAELHKGIRPFICQLCDKSYGRKDYLDRHMKSHLEEGGGGEGATDENGRRLNNTEDSTIITLKQDTDAEMGEEVILPNVVTVVSDSGV